MATDTYGHEFFDTIRHGCQRSAAAVAPIVYRVARPSAVIDVGCGEGWWGEAFAAAGGCLVLGVDGAYANPVIPHETVDLEQRIPELGRFDLAVCLEVAEHLPPERAATFVEDLCELAPIVLFSAAIPGQGGTGHLNEQWPAYWVELFARHHYACSGALRWSIWDDDRVENWYRQNLMVAAADPAALPEWFDTPLAPMWPVVHPVLYDARRS
jgi:SAM-dependent methyltransferase